MSKITLSAILTILRVVLTLGEKILRTVYTILDIVDDGVINASVSRPEWYDKVVCAIGNIERALSSLTSVQDELTLPQNDNA